MQPLGDTGVIVYLTTPCIVLLGLFKDCTIVVPHDEIQLLNPVITAPENDAAVQVYDVPGMVELKTTFVDDPLHIV